MLLNHSKDFALDPLKTWLNTASEGPIPLCAKIALEEAVLWKLSPDRLTIPKFQQVPIELKYAIASLIHVDAHDIILGNSATYGLHILANGLPLQSGDDVILMQNDFPSDILPWLSLTSKGVSVRQIKPLEYVLTYEQIKSAILPQTKVICLPYIHSFSGHRLDIPSIGKMCQDLGIYVVVNISQAAGIIPINMPSLPIDAVVCAGYKWLLGPYGTGFCWIKPKLRNMLNYSHNYWISLMTQEDLNSNEELSLIDDHSSRRYDIFATANFFNFIPWISSINYLNKIGIDHIHLHNSLLGESFINHLDDSRYHIISPRQKGESPLIVFSHIDSHLNKEIHSKLIEQGFHLAIWKNNLRLSPHLFNNNIEIGLLVKALNEFK